MKRLIATVLFVAGSLALMAPALTVPASASPTISTAHLLRATITMDQDFYLIGANVTPANLKVDSYNFGAAIRSAGSPKLTAEFNTVLHLLGTVTNANVDAVITKIESELNTMINQELGLAPAGLNTTTSA